MPAAKKNAAKPAPDPQETADTAPPAAAPEDAPRRPPPEAVANAPHVIRAISSVRNEIDSKGIGKNREVTDGAKFKFRGIDDVMNEFSGPMLRAGLMLIPSYSDLVVNERRTASNKPDYNASVTGSFRFVSLVDGTELPIGSFYGEANDTRDKAIAKAQSISLRQAYLQTFVVPLGPEMDNEFSIDLSVGDDVVEDPPAPRQRQQAQQRKPAAGEVVDPLKDAQKRILLGKGEQKGLADMDAIEGGFGRPINTANFNDAMDYIKNLPARGR